MSPPNKRRFKINSTFYCAISSFVTAISIIIKSHANVRFIFIVNVFRVIGKDNEKNIENMYFFSGCVFKRYEMFSLRTFLSSKHAYLVEIITREKKCCPKNSRFFSTRKNQTIFLALNIYHIRVNPTNDRK